MYIYIRNIFWNILVICIYTIYIPSDTRPLSHLPRPCPRSDASHGPDPFPASQDAPGRKLNRGISRNVRFLYIFDSYGYIWYMVYTYLWFIFIYFWFIFLNKCWCVYMCIWYMIHMVLGVYMVNMVLYMLFICFLCGSLCVIVFKYGFWYGFYIVCTINQLLCMALWFPIWLIILPMVLEWQPWLYRV
jgi:glycosyltransferase involved in cell wall biosynthesis